MRAFKHAESLKRHELKEAFSDVYGGEEPLNLVGVPVLSPLPARCDRQNSDASPCAYRKSNVRNSVGSLGNTAPRGSRGKLNSRSSRTMGRVSLGAQDKRLYSKSLVLVTPCPCIDLMQ